MLDLDSLNPPQREAVTTIRGPVLILAGAGTGKTRVITARIAYLLAKGVPPGQVLGVTFTNKAAREMLDRVRQLVGRARTDRADRRADRPTLSTFHSLCVRILRQHIDRLGYKQNFVIYDESDQLAAVRKVLSRISTGGGKVDPGKVLAWLSRFKNGGRLPASNETAEMAEHVRSRYDAALKACNAVDFDDLLLLVLRLFDEHSDVLEACRNRYRYVMVDEYQDTNAAQFRIVHALTREHRNLCVVGDDDQSIYGWRGAEVANLLDLEKHFPEVKVVKLEQNYRSTATILNAANAVIRHNTRRRGKQLWSDRGQGSRILFHVFADEDEEANTVVEEIEVARQSQQVPWSQQAILFRTNLQSRPLESALRRAGVRYHLIGGQSFFDRREIRDVVAYLKVLLNPEDDVNLLRIANTPARGLSEQTMERLLAASHERRCSVHAAMKDPAAQAALNPRACESAQEFVGLLERSRSALVAEGSINVRQWAEAFIREIGYLDELRRSERDPADAENRVRNVLEFLASLEPREIDEPGPTARLQEFLDDVSLDREKNDETTNRSDAVTLITIHSCKGLEFPHVYIVGLEDGLLPHSRSKEEGTVDEERRLFYVAITRAKVSLTLSHCCARKKYGQLLPCHPSPFLKEIPEEFVEAASPKSRQPVPVESGKARFASLRAAIE